MSRELTQWKKDNYVAVQLKYQNSEEEKMNTACAVFCLSTLVTLITFMFNHDFTCMNTHIVVGECITSVSLKFKGLP